MAKKCIPGVVCIENVTLIFIILLLISVFYIFYIVNKNQVTNNHFSHETNTSSQNHLPMLMPISSKQDIFNDPYAPPLKDNSYLHPRDSGDIRGIPVNIETRALPTSYQQIGILNKTNDSNDIILPLMGKRTMAGRDKWQYYTISGSGNLNTRLPISVNGKNCSSEYGCDEIYNGDVIYVEGYNDTFQATIYENNNFHYIPVI
tara:strand:- start:25919 stop:26527 length:609 start_codon:yes stop_codon:yes gene_type:complete